MTGRVSKIKGIQKYFLLLCLACLLNPVAHSVEPDPGQIYSGGSLIDSHELGVQFSIPNNWKGGLHPSGEIFLMEPQGGGAIMFAIADIMSPDQAYQLLQGPVEVPDVGQLNPRGSISRSGNIFSAIYEVAFNPALAAEVRAKSADNGTSIAFFLVSEKAQMQRMRQQLDGVFGSLKTHEVQSIAETSEPENNTAAGTDNKWLTYLKGKHIVRFFTTSGYTEEQHIWLCSNGNYIRRFDSGGFGGGASGAVQANYDGTWTATGEGERGRLILNSADGQVSFNLRWDYDTSRLYVDGKRWLHDKNDACR